MRNTDNMRSSASTKRLMKKKYLIIFKYFELTVFPLSQLSLVP